jgi:hypothetical protein
MRAATRSTGGHEIDHRVLAGWLSARIGVAWSGSRAAEAGARPAADVGGGATANSCMSVRYFRSLAKEFRVYRIIACRELA